MEALFWFKYIVFIHNFDGNLVRKVGTYYEYLNSFWCQFWVQQKLNNQTLMPVTPFLSLAQK